MLGKLTENDIQLKYWYLKPKVWSQLSYEGKYNALSPPSKDDIIQQYKQQRKHYFDLVHNAKFKDILDALEFKRDESGKIIATTQKQAVSAAVTNFYKAINSIYSAKKTDDGKVEAHASQLKQLLATLKAVQRDAEAGSIQLLQGDLTRLQSFIDTVNNNLAIAQQMGSVKMQRSIFGQAASLRSALGGAILESKMVKELQKYNLNGAKLVFNTGQMTDFRGKAIKPDAMIVPPGTVLKNKEGKIIGTFTNDGFEVADGITKIQVDLEQIEPYLGISAKTAKQPNFGQQVNINTFLDEASVDGDEKIYELIHMYQLGTALQDPSAINSHLAAYQGYASAKMCQKVIGKYNAFIATRGAIVPTYQYIDQMINSNRIQSMLRFSNRQLPARERGEPLNSKFGTTDIRGSMLKF